MLFSGFVNAYVLSTDEEKVMCEALCGYSYYLDFMVTSSLDLVLTMNNKTNIC